MQDYTIPHKEKLLEIIENYLLCEYKKKLPSITFGKSSLKPDRSIMALGVSLCVFKDRGY